MEYNVKVCKFANGKTQVRVYNLPIIKNDEINKLITSKANKTKKINRDKFRTEEEIEHSIANSKNRTIQNIFNIARSNNWTWFCTFTFDPKRVNRQNYDNCYSCLYSWLKSMKKKYPDIKYIIVPELHPSDGVSWHFHGLFSNCPDSMFTLKHINYKHEEIYNINGFDYFGLINSATKIKDSNKSAMYIAKYIKKDLVTKTLGKHRYLYSKNCERPQVAENSINYNDLYKYLIRIQDKIQYTKTCDYYNNNIMYIECDDIGDIFDWQFSECEFEEL